MAERRRLSMGAEPQPDGGVHFRVWAPQCNKIELVLEGAETGRGKKSCSMELTAEEGGYFSCVCMEADTGSLYRYRLDGGKELFPDPASRFQPDGPNGPSCVVYPVFAWSDQAWKGLNLQGQVLYELHIGTFTSEGNWRAAAAHLPELAELGITAVEVMPVADYPGDFGWGYDGVNLFAPTRLYGTPDDFRQFVDVAHSLRIGVILDVVYNHFGPEGNYLNNYSKDFYTDRYTNEWGNSINFDGVNSGPVREYYMDNAAYWIDEFHVDGLRFDATQVVFDSSPRHILGCIAERARQAAGKRSILLIAENEPQQVTCLRPHQQGGYGMDAVWNDDFHHSAHVALTGYTEAYYSGYQGSPQELISAVKWGFLYQGQYYFWQSKRRGTATFGFKRSSFINYLQNHDQIANSAWGTRTHRLANPGSYRAMTALLLLSPGTPMLFQGQEFAASSPFLYFSDLNPDVARQTWQGRIEFLSQFGNIHSPDILDSLDNPSDRVTFERSRLDHSERQQNRQAYALHRDLISLRREDPVFNTMDTGFIEGAVLGPEGFAIRYFASGQQRLLLVNLGRDLHLNPVPEPLLAPPEKSRWDVMWSSERVEYGGAGIPELETDRFWIIPGHTAVVLLPTATGDLP